MDVNVDVDVASGSSLRVGLGGTSRSVGWGAAAMGPELEGDMLCFAKARCWDASNML